MEALSGFDLYSQVATAPNRTILTVFECNGTFHIGRGGRVVRVPDTRLKGWGSNPYVGRSVVGTDTATMSKCGQFHSPYIAFLPALASVEA